VAAPPERLTTLNIRNTLLRFFPGIEVTTGGRIGGWVVKAEVWRFRFQVSLTTEKIAATDKPGVATFSAGYLGPNNKVLSLAQATADSVEELAALIKGQHEELMGVVAAIEMACSPPVVLPPVSIFDDPPEQ